MLYGVVNPSGKLTETFPLALSDTPSYLNFPGESGSVRYGEGIYMGYRGYEALNREVLFPFGYGLSYTQFRYDNLHISRASFTAEEAIARVSLQEKADARVGKLSGGQKQQLAVACAIVPLFFGEAPLTSQFWEAELPVLGHVEFVTSTIFDVGVYLVVIGLVLDVLRSLGAEVDRQAQESPAAQGVSVS